MNVLYQAQPARVTHAIASAILRVNQVEDSLVPQWSDSTMPCEMDAGWHWHTPRPWTLKCIIPKGASLKGAVAALFAATPASGLHRRPCAAEL